MSNAEENPIRVLLAIGSPAKEREVRDALAECGFVVAERCLDGPSLAERAQAFDADVGVASSDLHRLTAASLSAIREARLPLVLLADPADFERYAGLAHCVARTAFATEIAAAARQALARGVAYEVAPSVNGARPRPGDESGGRENDGRVTVLVGGKGAPGVTTLAIGLAAALAERDRRVVVVDADLRGGNVVPYLDLDPSRGILGLGVGRHGSSGVPVEEELQDGPGFLVLAGIERPETYRSLPAELVVAAVSRLREVYDDVVVDAGQVVAGASSSAAEGLARLADRTLVVAGADLIAAWNAQCCVRYLREEVGLAPGSIGVLLNRHSRAGFGAREVEQALGALVLAVVPEDRGGAQRAAARQVPITDSSRKARRALRSLAAELVEQPASAGQERTVRRWRLRPRLAPIGRR